MDSLFIINSVLFGFALAMDAFSLSIANGLAEPHMKRKKSVIIAGVFGLFQFGMPLVGWVMVHWVVSIFSAVEKAIPYFALIVLTVIGGKMILEYIKNRKSTEEPSKVLLSVGMLIVQGIATSIDALSVGLATQGVKFYMAAVSALIIGAVTYGVCRAGIEIGKVFGDKFSGKATLLGGIILIAIGVEIFVKGVFF
ncbi:MAG: manganese efflux pump [Eubacterium sp.]|nr:manganese efflux pump [Eubacterium sp.]